LNTGVSAILLKVEASAKADLNDRRHFHPHRVLTRGTAPRDVASVNPVNPTHMASLTPVPLFIFARFHARDGRDVDLAATIRDTVAASRDEPGCLAIHFYRSTHDPRLFYIHSSWVDEPAFEQHATLPHTVRFLERVRPLIDHDLDITRATRIE
jgi:quinol monooxygenase YgiN